MDKDDGSDIRNVCKEPQWLINIVLHQKFLLFYIETYMKYWVIFTVTMLIKPGIFVLQYVYAFRNCIIILNT